MIEQRTFNNRYRLDRKLGEGGMATVYCGTDTLLRRSVAIKVLRDQYAADEEFVRRFYQEAESAAKLSHPNIVNTYDVGREGDTYYIVMELVDGPSLAEIITADGKLPEPVAVDFAAQICNGLAYAHRQGLLHRDIKPANILVTKDDVCKISDFGIARAISKQTMTMTKPGLVMGSVFYISPEQAQGHELHEASDLYSVGVVIYQMLTGDLPFVGESPVTVAIKHIHDPVPVLDTKQLGVSPALAAIVNKLLQKRPENRFQSASDVASALREARERPSVAGYRIQNDAPTPAQPDLPPRRSPMPDLKYSSMSDEEERRSRSGTGIIATLVIVTLLAIAAGYFIFNRPLPNFAATISLQDYTGMSDVQAQQAIVNAGLVARFEKSPSDTVPANHVIRQTPLAGAKVERNSLVVLILSNGLPTVGMRDLRGFVVGDAQRILQDDRFNVKVVRRFDNAAKDSVIDQLPKPGSQVRRQSAITLIVSNGPQPIALPNFVGMTVADAQALAQKDQIALDTSQQESIAGVAPNVIASQDLPAGQPIDRTTSVHVVVSSGGGQGAQSGSVAVPDVVSQSTPYDAALKKLTDASFPVKVQFSVQSTANGTIVSQDPAPNAQVAPGTMITVTLAVPGEVPDTVGMTIDGARSALAAAGYSIGTIQHTSAEGSNGNAVRTDPEVGTTLAPGSSVTLIVNGP